ncbi:protein translocase subunit SECA2 [Cucumis melo var. makuwa]|uniref:Protein translocase subunit SECA2 n=1 Tax=Cucumis melo var. makuwa TaxID=1194695 RepID=A0A5A7TPN8_CUCMM|nr:protein translocase subunit SECA2 [Cucumis melo var. makuwa]
MATARAFPKPPSLLPSLQPTIGFVSPVSFQTSSSLPYRLRRHRSIVTSHQRLQFFCLNIYSVYTVVGLGEFWVCSKDSLNDFELQMRSLTDEQLTAKTSEFRRRLRQGERETLADVQSG